MYKFKFYLRGKNETVLIKKDHKVDSLKEMKNKTFITFFWYYLPEYRLPLPTEAEWGNHGSRCGGQRDIMLCQKKYPWF
jgi:hypothetical protein